MHYPVCTKATLRLLYFLFVWMNFSPRLIFKPSSPHMYVDLDSRVGCHLNRTPRPYLCKALMKEPCLFFLQVWTLRWRSYVLNKIIVSPVLSWPLVAKQPRLPESHSSSLCTDAGTYVSIPNGCKSVAVTRRTCCWLSCWLITWRPSHLTPYYEL